MESFLYALYVLHMPAGGDAAQISGTLAHRTADELYGSPPSLLATAARGWRRRRRAPACGVVGCPSAALSSLSVVAVARDQAVPLSRVRSRALIESFPNASETPSWGPALLRRPAGLARWCEALLNFERQPELRVASFPLLTRTPRTEPPAHTESLHRFKASTAFWHRNSVAGGVSDRSAEISFLSSPPPSRVLTKAPLPARAWRQPSCSTGPQCGTRSSL